MVVPDSDPEVKKSVNLMKVEKDIPSHPLDSLMAHYSSWTRLKRAVGWFLLLKMMLHDEVVRSKDQQQHVECKMSIIILDVAERLLIVHTQAKHFEKELKALENNGNHVDRIRMVSKSSSLRKLTPFLKDGILRVGGRLHWADITYDAKHPFILPKDSPVSRLILEHTHREVGHMGRNSMLSNLRQRYWIVGASSAIKSLTSRCVICRKYQAPVGEQIMADLPTDRLLPDIPPFSHVGMDYFGPFHVKHGRSTVKRYGVLFTCLTIRAVHLEVARSLDTDSCINVIRRFIARREPPKIIRSDNGTNLVGSEKELRLELAKLDKHKLHSVMLNKGVDWIFNPPAASHHGGVWERLMRSVRKIMYSVMQEQVIKLDDEGLSTLLCEVESILNNRPITEASLDVNDLEPLTPNHLLRCYSGETMPPGVFDKDDVYSRRRWGQIQYLADIFWKRWTREYLPLLQERMKWTSGKRNMSVHDVVLLMDNAPRNAWCLEKVTETISDRKGYVRVVKVKMATTELVRPVDKLCVLILSADK